MAVPLVVALVAVLGQRYVPIGDEAAILYRAEQVGTGDTPLVGSYSTRGWAHPGPVLFYVLALPLRLTGGAPGAAVVAAALLNLAAVALALYLAHRRRGLLGVAVVGAAIATLLSGLGPDALVSFWNPLVPLLLYLAFLLALWGIAEGDRPLLPLAAGLGSATVQLHVSYLPLVVLGAATAAGCARRRRPAAGPNGPSPWRSTAVVLGLLWVPPLVDLVVGSGNLATLVDYFRTSDAPKAGLSTGFRLVGAHLGLGGPWTGGGEVLAPLVTSGDLVWVLLVGGLLGLAALTAVRRGHDAGLPVVALGQLVAAGFAASRAEEPVEGYLIAWLLPLAAFCWAAIVLVAVGAAPTRAARPTRAREVAVTLSLVVLAVQTVVTAPAYARAAPPEQAFAPAVTDVLDQLRRQVRDGDVIRVESLGDRFGRPFPGVFYGLAQRDLTWYTSDGSDGEKWGPRHRWDGQRVDYTLTVVVTEEAGPIGADQRCQADGRHEQIARWERPVNARTGPLLGLAVFRGADVCGV